MNCVLPTTGIADVLPLLIVAGILAAAGVGFLVFHRLRRGGKLSVRATAALVILPLAVGGLLLTAVPAAPAQAATTCVPVAGGDPGDPGNLGGNGTGGPGSSTPTPTPTPTSTVPPVCTPTTKPDITFTFANWDINSNFIQSPALVPASSLPELVEIRGESGWVPSDGQTTVTSTNPAGTATAQSANANYNNADGSGTLDLDGVLTLASTIGADNDFTVSDVTNFPYSDGCGNTLFATVTYTGFYHVAPSIPQ
ncbi:MAG TPA: LPXTG cell wall anchor domain-containing protein [Galbitalea sp.]|jgi:LPXTG-motif cell wall-anchored protein|nr:LPXTG cell wall anchor domain-containing protein [Galbitalea sp.]